MFDAHGRACRLFYSSCLSSAWAPALPPPFLLRILLLVHETQLSLPTTIAITVKYEKIPIAVSRRLPLHPLFVARQRDNLDARSTIRSFLEMETSPSAKSPRGLADFPHAVRDIRDICWGDIRTTGDDVWKRAATSLAGNAAK